MHVLQNRRRFMAGVASVSAAGLLGTASHASADAPLETTSVRLPRWIDGAYCWAGLYLAGELLRADGFSDVRYVQGDPKLDQWWWIANGQTDFSVNYVPVHLRSIDTGIPIKVLAGLHVGCMELVANEHVKDITDLRGKRVGTPDLNSLHYVLVALMTAYVGIDPTREIDWVIWQGKPAQGFAEGKFDAFLFTPPATQQLRAKKIGHTILNNTLDRPWSQHFCCMVSATSDYASKYPVATKRVLRAIVRGADLCASDPKWSAGKLVERGFLPNYEFALQTLKDTRYDAWRDYDPEASVRFYALRMQETGMIKSSPQQILADGTDFRFISELKRELKA